MVKFIYRLDNIGLKWYLSKSEVSMVRNEKVISLPTDQRAHLSTFVSRINIQSKVNGYYSRPKARVVASPRITRKL